VGLLPQISHSALGAAKKLTPTGRFVRIAVKSSTALQSQCLPSKTRCAIPNTGIIMAGAVQGVSSEATREDIAGEKDFSAVFSHPELPALPSGII